MTQTWSRSVAARVADIPDRKLRAWLDHSVIHLRRNDKKPTGSGDPCGFSRTRIVQTAITAELCGLGLSPKRAAKAAFEFTDNADDDRPACELHTFGRTVLVVTKQRVRVANTGFDLGLPEFVPAAVIVDLNSIIASVDAKLKEKS